ncbi:MAG: Ig-like domain-containing protein, partial [Fuerstiella sp.]
SDGSFVYTPNPGFSGSDTFTYSVTDIAGNCTFATVTLDVGDAPVNTAPVAVDDYATTDFETSVSGNVLTNDSDAEGDTLQSSIETGPENGSIELNSDGSFVYTPNPGFSGSDTFTYSVTDIAGNCTFATVTLDVGDAPVNTAPVAVDDFATGVAGQEISGSVLDNDYDADGDGLSVAPITDFQTAEGGTVALKQDGTFVYQPADGYYGVDSFNYVLTDAAGNSATATVVVEVQPLPITIQDDSYSVVNNGGVITGVVTENDGPNSPDVIARIVENPEFGTLVFAEDGSFEYQADEGFSGRDSFQYVLAHGCQTSEVATASLIVSNVQYDTTHESAGNGRIWGDPHFIGDDGGLYDVQGEAGKIYSLLSDQNLQVNALFIPWEIHPGSTMMGAIGVTSGTDQIVGDLTGTTVNGVVLEAGQTVEIEAGTVSYDGEFTTITTGEYELELHRRDGWYDMNLDSLDPFQDNVAPHGLWGLTVDADTEARDGDFFKNDGYDYTLQGGGAIDTVDENGQIVRTERGDRSAYNLYETAELLSVTALNSEADVLFRFAAAEGTGLSPI